ncbi:MAG: hypothetical protein ABI729_07110, partial [Chitinophagales bacterium]
MDLRTNVDQLNQMILEGKILDAFEKFYADDDTAFLVETKGLDVEIGAETIFPTDALDTMFREDRRLSSFSYTKNVFL